MDGAPRTFLVPREGLNIKDRIKRELLDEPQQNTGASTVFIGVVFGSIWLFLAYALPGQSWWDAKFLIAAICFMFWGTADLLPHGWRTVAAILRVAVLVFMLAIGAWILFDMFASF